MDDFESDVWTDKIEVRIEKSYKHTMVAKFQQKNRYNIHMEDIDKVRLGQPFK